MSYTLLTETVRKARKQHQCIWCPEKIEAGQKYIDERSVYDGIQHHHWHPECRDAANIFFRQNPDETEFAPHESKRGSSEQF